MKKILVVDNHPVILKLLVDFLNKEGHEVRIAEDGLDALEILKTFRPDLVFTDLIMPNISGEKLCQVIRSRPELEKTPIVIYSATVLEDESNIARLKADACIAKGPFKNTEAHIRTVFAHIDKGTLQELSGKILGREELFKRHITSELLFSKRHYEAIFDSMPEAVLEFTREGKIFHANAAAMGLCSLPEENLLASRFLELFNPNQRLRLRTILAQLDQTPVFIDENDPAVLNGRKVSISFLAIRDEEHAFFVAIMRDLTEKIRTTKELNRLRNQYERILNAVGEGVFGFDARNRISFINPAALSILGYEQSEIVGQPLETIIHSCLPQNAAAEIDGECAISATGNDGIIRKGTETFCRKNGADFPVQYTCTPIIEEGEIIGSVVAFADITERKRWEEKLRKSSVTDELTGLLNRRGFISFSEKLIRISARDKMDLLLFYIDFDNMKWINDTFGHQVGDQALVETAILLQDTFRLADVIGRIGGDEFVILCTENSHLGNEDAILRRLTGNITQTNSNPSRKYPLSLSYGVARLRHESPCSISELLSQADSEMYVNKEKRKKMHTDGYKH